MMSALFLTMMTLPGRRVGSAMDTFAAPTWTDRLNIPGSPLFRRLREQSVLPIVALIVYSVSRHEHDRGVVVCSLQPVAWMISLALLLVSSGIRRKDESLPPLRLGFRCGFPCYHVVGAHRLMVEEYDPSWF